MKLSTVIAIVIASFLLTACAGSRDFEPPNIFDDCRTFSKNC
jgi:hypothetical protein